MADRISRPSYYEGQILSAADLDLGQEYARGTLARHERYLHTPGIAAGLELSVDKSTGVIQVKLAPGVAVDATGRAIVVDREEVLSPETLTSQGVLIPADTAPMTQEVRPWHPVFLVARDESSTPPAFARGCGSNGQPNRMDEAYDLSYGRPGEELDPPVAVEITDGPESATAVPVLIGFVQWDGFSGFGDAKTIPKAGMSPAFAGARADEVVARGGTLSLRADQGSTRDKRPALVLDGGNGGEMQFGLQNERGVVTAPVFSVDAGGNVTLSGVIKSPFTNDMWIESGTIFDGMTVPLPAGITQQKVDEGAIALHVTVTPRWINEPRPPGQAAGDWFKVPLECRVDGRRVFVRERWFDVAAGLGTSTIVAAACDYVVIASVAGRSPP